MWFRSANSAIDFHSAHKARRRPPRSRFSVRDIYLEPLEDRRMLSFTPAVDYAAGPSPMAIVSADFNSDGRLDLATAGYAGSVSVLLGKADGTFQAAQTSPNGYGALSVAVGDFNADGKLDLVTANVGDLSVLLGNGNGTFQAPTSIVIDGTAPTSVAVGDVNGDGKLDLGVTSNTQYPGYSGAYGSFPEYYLGRANVLLGNGDGSFPTRANIMAEFSYFTAATLADFNGDGKLDFAVANRDSGFVVMALGTGNGSFGASAYAAYSPTIYSMVAGDVNGDGKRDLVTASQNGSNNVDVLLGTGTGSFLPNQVYSSGSYPSSFAIGDLNGDGNADILTPSSVDHTLGVLLGVAGTFRPAVSVPTGFGPYAVVVGDFNGDGRQDAATANFSANSVSVLLNDAIWPATDLPTFTIGDLPPIVEGNVGTVQAVFTVSLSSAYAQPITVSYTTADGSATSASGDYQAKSGTLTFAPGQTSQAVTILVNGDRAAESSETFSIKLSNPTNAFLLDTVGVETIQDDEPYLSISSASGLEGNTGTTPFLFTVTLSAPSDAPVKVGFATSNLPYEWAAFSEAIADVDYQATSGTLTFAPGETSKPITVLVNGDRSPGEYDEYFFVNLNSPEGAGLTGGQTYGGIQDDEPLVGFGYASVTEGNSGTTPMVFTAMLSAAYDAPITVGYTTYDGSATAGIDYTPTSGTLTFAPGETSRTVSVLVNGDTVYEGDDYFNLSIVESNSATFDYYYGYAVGTIVDDDPNTPQITISDVSKNEGNAGNTAFVFTASLSAASSSRVTVKYATANGSAAANGDFQATSGTITFAAGQTSKTVTVQVKGDTAAESDESFELNLSDASGATIADAQGIGTIVDDDVPKIRISDVSKNEGNSGTTPFVFTVSLSATSDAAVKVKYATANGSAASSDYQAASGTLTFSPGQTTKTVTVLVKGDVTAESQENFLVNLSNASGATIDDAQGKGTIVDDDKPRIRINDVSKSESNSGTTSFAFTVSLSAPSSSRVTVHYTTDNGTAKRSDNDYDRERGKLTFAPGETTKTITVLVSGDKKQEANETFFVKLADANGATFDDYLGIGTILDDDGKSSKGDSVKTPKGENPKQGR